MEVAASPYYSPSFVNKYTIRLCIIILLEIHHFFIVISFSVSGPEATFSVSQNLTISCEVSILVSNLTVDLSWVDMNNNEVNDTEDIYVDSEQSLNDYVSLDLVIEDIKVSHAGVYTCIATLVDNIGSATINRTHAVNVQSKNCLYTFVIM